MNSVNGVVLGGSVAARDVTAQKRPGAFKNALDEATAPSGDTKKIAKAARGFEALMIGQVMKAAHGSDSEGWFGAGDDDESSSTAIQMAEEYLGQAMAQSGGLGIAKMVVKNLSKPPGPLNAVPLPSGHGSVTSGHGSVTSGHGSGQSPTPPSSGQATENQTQTRTGSLPQLGSHGTR
ncbi:MAG: hypothetical protein ABSH09_01910 [Bryobacteraceae bacterium]